MKIIAVSDVHSPRYLLHYMSALSRHKSDCETATILIWAGDMVDKGRINALQQVVAVTRRICGHKSIVAVFGNEEYMDLERKFIEKYNDIIWLNDSYMTLNVNGICYGIYGTRGALDRPTRWQERNIPNIRLIYRLRVERLRKTLQKLRTVCQKIIVVMHYAPTYATLEGEDEKIWPEIGSKAMEEALLEVKPDIVIHGHAHKSKRLEVDIQGIRVYNVALPARGDVTVIEV